MKKGISALKKLITHRKSLIEGLQDKSKSWNVGNEPFCINVVDMFTDFLQKEIDYLQTVVQYLENPTKCKHPKKHRDKCGDIWYCMKCNSDL